MSLGAIQIVTGVGAATTELAAFDRALVQCGLENLNLICLSSVIPPAVIRVQERVQVEESHWGSKCFCVLSRAETARPGETVSAGLGWVQHPETLNGLFVEHHASTAASVESLCAQSLSDMVKDRTSSFPPPHCVTATVTCVDQPVCAVVVAVFSIESWGLSPAI